MELNQLESLRPDELTKLPVDVLLSLIDEQQHRPKILNFIFTKYLNSFHFQSFDEKIFRPFLPKIDFNLDEAEIRSSKVNIQLLGMLVKNIVNLVKESNDSQSIASISTLVLFSIRILHKFYRKFAGESEKDGDDLDRDVTYLHSIVLVLLKSEQIAVSPETQSISVSEKILNDLCNLIDAQTNSQFNNIKTVADSWKCFSKISFSLAKALAEAKTIGLLDFNSRQSQSWLDLSAQVLSSEIRNIFNEISVATEAEEPMIDRSLKMVVFLLKILQKVLKDFSPIYVVTGESVSTISDLVVRSLKLSNLSVNSATAGTLSTLIEFLANEIILAKNDIENISHCLRISTALSCNKNHFPVPELVFSVFEFILNSPVHLNLNCDAHNELFDQHVINATALLISQKNQTDLCRRMESRLASAITRTDNITAGLLFVDIWCLYLKYACDETKIEYLTFWLNVYSSIECVHLSHSLTKILVRKIYSMMSQTYQKLVQNKCSDNWEYFDALGWTNMDNKSNAFEHLSEAIMDDVGNAFEKLKQEKDAESYFQFIDILQCLAIKLAQQEHRSNEGAINAVKDIVTNFHRENLEKDKNLQFVLNGIALELGNQELDDLMQSAITANYLVQNENFLLHQIESINRMIVSSSPNIFHLKMLQILYSKSTDHRWKSTIDLLMAKFTKSSTNGATRCDNASHLHSAIDEIRTKVKKVANSLSHNSRKIIILNSILNSLDELDK